MFNNTIFSLLCIGLLYSVPAIAQTAIGGSTPNGSAMLDVQSINKGVLFPRIADPTTITSPATGLMIFNTGSRCLQINLGTPTAPAWQNIKCTSCGAYVSPGVWKELMCHNLGADTNADPFAPSWKLIGNYYQWGRKDVAAAGPSNENTPNADAPGTWNGSPAADGAWLDNSKTTNDPCPSGFRVPTIAQWEGILTNVDQNTPSNEGGDTWTEGNNNYTHGKFFGPALFLPVAGRRDSTLGALNNRGSSGFYWSSTISGSTDGRNLFFNSGGYAVETYDRAYGFSVRCIAE